MNRRIKVYMAGPISNVEDGGKTWRDTVKKQYLQIDWLDPLDQYNSAAEIEVVYSDEHIDTGDKVSTASIVDFDKSCIDEADAVLVNWPDVQSDGTAMEVLYAYEHDTPVVVRMDKEVSYDKSDWLSIWMYHHSDYMTRTFEKAINHIVYHIPLLNEMAEVENKLEIK